jgi:propionyl-CoA carboxylase alpha chain
MRIAHSDAEAREGFALSRSEAKASFGDDRIFIEKFIEQPRHIEIQLLGDQHGNIVYLNERECSIQRRNQKVIEEAPSPFLDAATRRAMGEQAVALAQAVGYFSAGTVEFIVDASRNFYFLEMNTRLQVEHPVTELIIGVDLVEQMIRVAAGEKLAFTQADVKLNGWAIESRLYAEDPTRNFLPSIGRLSRYRPPSEGVQPDGTVLRNDTGVFEGGEISMFYDPMIAKLCSWGKNRETAIGGMAEALDGFEVEGIGHNLAFLSAVMGNARFREGKLTTAFIAEEFPEGFKGVAPGADDIEDFAAVATFVHLKRERRAAQISGSMENHNREFGGEWSATVGGTSVPLHVAWDNGHLHLAVNGSPAKTITSDWTPGMKLGHFQVGERQLAVKVATHVAGYRLRRRGMDVVVKVQSLRVAELAALMPVKKLKDTSRLLLCPMPGLVRQISVKAGDTVEAGQSLAVVEAMKMENVLRAERRAKVKRVAVAVGDSLAVDQLILEFEA